MANNDETDLVDVGELPHEEDVTGASRREISEELVTAADDSSEAQPDHPAEDPFAMQMEAAKPGQATIASLRERLAAFLIDVGFLWLLFWGCLYGYHKITTHSWIGDVPTMGTAALFFHGGFLLIAFLYFFLLEAAFFATIGKFCCWMYVRRKDGRHAGALGIFIRNFFRLIELLTGGLLTWVPMELTRRHQRLGDLAAGTIVIKKHSASARYYTLDADRLASAFGRSFALLIDLILVTIWLVGYVMLINYQTIYISQWLVIAFPVLSILFWTVAQFVLETTPGLWLLGYTITHEDGGRLTFAGALIRVLLSPLDLVMGLPCMLLSLRKQKSGDLIAATVVSHQRRRWKGAVGSLVVVALSVGLVALGLFLNPINNIFKAGADFKLSFMPMVQGLPTWESSSLAQPSVLAVRNFRFGANDANTLRTPAVYKPGETVYLLFEIYGYMRRERLVWIQEDLTVQYPDGSIGLKQENVVDYHQLIKPGGGPIELTNNIALPPSAAPGSYVVTITLRDMLANKYMVTETQSFMVKAPPTMTSPLEALPPPPPAPSPIPLNPYATPTSVGIPGSVGAPGSVRGEPVEPQTAPATPTVPSSPLPVVPAAPAAGPTPPAPVTPGAPAPVTPSVPTPAPVPTPATPVTAVPPSKAVTPTTPSTGFTVLPGPTLAPKEEITPPATIPVPAPVPEKSILGVTPADHYAKPALTPSPMPTPPVASTPSPPAPEKPGIVEKTLTPTPVKPVDHYGAAPAAASPVDHYAKPVEKAVIPAAVPPPASTPAPTKAAPAPPAPTTEKKKIAPAVKKPAPKEKAAVPATETQKAAEKELQKMPQPKPAVKPAAPVPAPVVTPAKPAAEIPSAAAVKKESQQKTAPKKKKKKSAEGGGGGAGYMP